MCIRDRYKEYPLAAFQGVADKDITHLYFSLQKNIPSAKQTGVKNVYTLVLNSGVENPPQWFKNHRNKGMDVVVQDTENVLYLFSNTGKLFWKKQLSGKIIGKIHQVDLYKNNRWQLAFRTAERLIVLDRNGNILKPFNIKLPKSSNPLPLAVFDYDNNRNYRFLIAQDRLLFMYNNQGKRLNGFTLKKVNSKIITCSISGFGDTKINRPAYDNIVQGYSGAMSITGMDKNNPVKSGIPIADLGAGLYAIIGILSAIRSREIYGYGEHVDISMLDTQVSLLTYMATMHFLSGENPVPIAVSYTHLTLPTSDLV